MPRGAEERAEPAGEADASWEVSETAESDMTVCARERGANKAVRAGPSAVEGSEGGNGGVTPVREHPIGVKAQSSSERARREGGIEGLAMVGNGFAMRNGGNRLDAKERKG